MIDSLAKNFVTIINDASDHATNTLKPVPEASDAPEKLNMNLMNCSMAQICVVISTVRFSLINF